MSVWYRYVLVIVKLVYIGLIEVYSRWRSSKRGLAYLSKEVGPEHYPKLERNMLWNVHRQLWAHNLYPCTSISTISEPILDPIHYASSSLVQTCLLTSLLAVADDVDVLGSHSLAF